MWVATAGMVPVVAAEPVAPPPVCGHPKQNGQLCTVRAQHPDGKCTVHHNMLVNHQDKIVLNRAVASARFRWRRGDAYDEIDAFVEETLPTIGERWRNNFRWRVDNLLLKDFMDAVQLMADAGDGRARMHEVINGWVALERVSERRGLILIGTADRLVRHREWRQAAAPPPVPGGREAQLAHDGQNVHTVEISKQMRDSIALLLAVKVPVTQVNTFEEMSASWRRLATTQKELDDVYADSVRWWNTSTIFATGDKLYRKCLRGLWWTIKNYKGEVRAELEKRLWQECREAAIPYSVCTQGHMARLSNVMVGFDEAFVPPIPVGEILQQRMAAISAMDVEYDKQIELAEAVLAELKIPHEEHKNWLAAF
jgi:hypothetical protein